MHPTLWPLYMRLRGLVLPAPGNPEERPNHHTQLTPPTSLPSVPCAQGTVPPLMTRSPGRETQLLTSCLSVESA